MTINNIIGKKYNKLYVLKNVGVDKHRNKIWECKCDCGNICKINTRDLKNGHTKSCGCYKKQIQIESKLSSKNPMWKGNKVGLVALHRWIERRKPKPEYCECCKINKPIDLANISQKYKRNINDYEWLCRKCHMTKDKRIKTRNTNGTFRSINN